MFSDLSVNPFSKYLSKHLSLRDAAQSAYRTKFCNTSRDEATAPFNGTLIRGRG